MKYIVHITLEIEAETKEELVEKIKEIIPDAELNITVLDEEEIKLKANLTEI